MKKFSRSLSITLNYREPTQAHNDEKKHANASDDQLLSLGSLRRKSTKLVLASRLVPSRFVGGGEEPQRIMGGRTRELRPPSSP